MVVLTLDRTKTKLAISFPYRQDLVDRIKLFPGRVWKRPFWLLPLNEQQVKDVEAAFKELDNVAKGQDLLDHLAKRNIENKQVLAWKQQGNSPELTKGTIFHTTPYEHQKKGLAFCQALEKFGLFMEMGTGKTKIILDLLGNYYKGNINWPPSLIVCPVSVMENWRLEALKHQPNLKVVVAQGTREQKLKTLRLIETKQAQIIVINYESLWRLVSQFALIPWWATVLDESTKIKHRATQQAKAVMKLGQRSMRRYILTGTPAPNNPLELFNQIKFLDPTIFGHSWYVFRDRYAIMGGYGNYQVLGWKNLPELTQKLGLISYRVMKKDCLDLPEKVYVEHRIKMTDEQSKVYKELAEDLVTSIKGVDVVASVVLAKLTKLRQLTSGFVYKTDKTSIRLDQNPKLDQLKEILESITESHKVVIWTSFRDEVEQITDLCKSLNLKSIKLDGSVPGHLRGEVVRNFQEDPNIKIFIGQQHAGGLGITLTAADYCIFYSNDYSYEIRAQAEDRLHRIGQKNQVTYIDLIMKGTLDATIKRMLAQKANLASSLVPSKLEELLFDQDEL